MWSVPGQLLISEVALQDSAEGAAAAGIAKRRQEQGISFLNVANLGLYLCCGDRTNPTLASPTLYHAGTATFFMGRGQGRAPVEVGTSDGCRSSLGMGLPKVAAAGTGTTLGRAKVKDPTELLSALLTATEYSSSLPLALTHVHISGDR